MSEVFRSFLFRVFLLAFVVRVIPVLLALNLGICVAAEPKLMNTAPRLRV